MRKKRAKFKQELDNDDDFRRWFENLQRGSEITANEQSRVLIRYLKHFGMKPADLVKRAKNDKKAVEDELADFITKKTKEGCRAHYLKNFVTVVRGYLKYHDIQLIRTIKLDRTTWGPTDDRVPTQEEFRTLLRASDLRTQAIEILMAHSGVRPHVLGDFKGEDGLRLKDIIDLNIKDNKVTFRNMPALIKVPARLSKNGANYHTFLTKEGCEILKNYLESRVRDTKEELNAESPVITISKVGYDRMGKRRTNDNYGSSFIMTQNITREIRNAWKKVVDKPPRPYVLRSYFDTRLMLAENEGKVSHTYRQHWMGHKGDIEHVYTLHKKNLQDDVITQMRKAYSACEPYLTTERKKPLTDDEKQEFQDMLSQKIKEFALSQAELSGVKINIRELDLKVQSGELTPEEEIQLIQKEIAKITIPQLQSKDTTYHNNHESEHKIVNETQLVKHLNDGWEFVKEINGNKYLVKN